MIRNKSIILGISCLTIGMNCMAGNFSFSDTLSISKSEPVYETFVVETPSQSCRRELVANQSSGSSDTVGGIVGGAIGGVLGNQVGKGSGKTAATIGGAILGAMAGSSMAGSKGETTYTEKEICSSNGTIREEKTRLLGYDNYAEYQGKTIKIRTREPVNHLPINVNISY